MAARYTTTRRENSKRSSHTQIPKKPRKNRKNLIENEHKKIEYLFFKKILIVMSFSFRKISKFFFLTGFCWFSNKFFVIFSLISGKWILNLLNWRSNSILRNVTRSGSLLKRNTFLAIVTAFTTFDLLTAQFPAFVLFRCHDSLFLWANYLFYCYCPI